MYDRLAWGGRFRKEIGDAKTYVKPFSYTLS